ncbi:hypothetical protein DYB28_012978 [Aphanomyces astaci]|uniref:Uncharacterized protein n=1 Tax=Aphanomyces astaci TaxID=112090 RepID=A0A9X8H7A5_APHAT|nr:hypothetical protein DYB28_012978 [Aphanomyces astaci]
MLDVNGDMHELSNDLRQRAGLICMDMVADMCHRFDLSSLVDLPSHVKHVRRLSRSLPMLITFVERVEVLTETGEDLVAVTAAHRDFVLTLRTVLGLSQHETRSDILELLQTYMHTIGLGAK